MWTGTLIALTAALALPAGSVSSSATATTALVAADAKTEAGTIKSVDTAAKSFVLTVGTGKDAKDVTVTVNDKTTYTLDGAASTMDKALAAGRKATVKHTAGLAASVDATTVKP